MHMVLNSNDGERNTEKSKPPPPIPECPQQGWGLSADRALPWLFLCALCPLGLGLFYSTWKCRAEALILGTAESCWPASHFFRWPGCFCLFLSQQRQLLGPGQLIQSLGFEGEELNKPTFPVTRFGFLKGRGSISDPLSSPLGLLLPHQAGSLQ